VIPPGGVPPVIIPPGSTPPIVIPPGSKPPIMPPATGSLPPTGYQRYAVWHPTQARYVYVFVRNDYRPTPTQRK
jgi:hypothetical protein